MRPPEDLYVHPSFDRGELGTAARSMRRDARPGRAGTRAASNVCGTPPDARPEGVPAALAEDGPGDAAQRARGAAVRPRGPADDARRGAAATEATGLGPGGV